MEVTQNLKAIYENRFTTEDFLRSGMLGGVGI